MPWPDSISLHRGPAKASKVLRSFGAFFTLVLLHFWNLTGNNEVGLTVTGRRSTSFSVISRRRRLFQQMKDEPGAGSTAASITPLFSVSS